VSRLSIIIPVGRNLGRLEDTLLSVLENRPQDAQIVVVLDEPYTDPYDLKSEGVEFLQAPLGAGEAAGINQGLEASRAPLVHVLSCGARVAEGWVDAAATHFADPWVAAVAPLVVDVEHPERVVAAGVTYTRGGRARTLGEGCEARDLIERPPLVLGPHPAAAFYRKSALELVGRFSAVVGNEFAAVDLALRLAYAGFRTVFEPQSVVCAYRAAERSGGAFCRAMHAERLFWRWAPCFGWLGSLPRHALAVGWELLGALPRPALLAQVAGRALGLCHFASGRRHYREVQPLRERARASVSAGERTGATPHARRARQRRAAR
jgi:hypothetical protein